MKASSFTYLSRQGVKNLWKNRMMTVASVGVLTACLLIVGVAVLLTENISAVVEYVESQNEFVAFIQTEENYSEQIGDYDDWSAVCDSIMAEIAAIDNVDSVEFVSKDEGLESLKSQFGENADLLDAYTGDENPLNDSITIRLVDLSLLDQTAAQVSAVTGVLSVSAASEVAETLTEIRHIVNVTGWSLVVALVIVSLVIIMNTIRATIFSRRKELNIMRYVGATKAFIHLPFLVEGVLLGLISAGISYLVIWRAYVYILSLLNNNGTSWLDTTLQHVIPFSAIALPLAGFFVGAGVLIGIVGSGMSIRNHIKV